MKYIQVQYLHSQGQEDIFRNSFSQEHFIRQKSYDNKHVYWINANHQDHEYIMEQFVKEDTIMQVVDGDGYVIFEDFVDLIDGQAKAIYKFPMVSELLRQHADDVKDGMELLTFDDWRKELLRIKEEQGKLFYSSYWIYHHQIQDSTHVIGDGRVMGRDVKLVAETYHHDLIDLKWEVIRWVNPLNNQPISTCGYRFV